MDEFDAVVIGAGPAGLSAALYLARGRRSVLVCDDGAPRNRQVIHSHGFLTRDGVAPAELARLAWADVSAYPSVRRRTGTVVDARKVDGAFVLAWADGTAVRARGVVYAAGMRDLLPPIPGLAETWGVGAFFCPFCHAWELQDEPLGVYGQDAYAAHMPFVARAWTERLTLFADGPFTGPEELRAKLARNGVQIEEARVRGLVLDGRALRAVVVEGGREVLCRGLLIKPPSEPVSDLCARLGAAMNEDGAPVLDRMGQTTVPMLFVAGDATGGLPTLVTALASGAMVGGALANFLAMAEAAAR